MAIDPTCTLQPGLVSLAFQEVAIHAKLEGLSKQIIEEIEEVALFQYGDKISLQELSRLKGVLLHKLDSLKEEALSIRDFQQKSTELLLFAKSEMGEIKKGAEIRHKTFEIGQQALIRRVVNDANLSKPSFLPERCTVTYAFSDKPYETTDVKSKSCTEGLKEISRQAKRNPDTPISNFSIHRQPIFGKEEHRSSFRWPIPASAATYALKKAEGQNPPHRSGFEFSQGVIPHVLTMPEERELKRCVVEHPLMQDPYTQEKGIAARVAEEAGSELGGRVLDPTMIRMAAGEIAKTMDTERPSNYATSLQTLTTMSIESVIIDCAREEK